MDPDTAELLVFNAGNVRNAAIISLLLSSGVRRSELANIKLADVDLDSRRIKVIGKGGKLGWLVYSEFTERMLKEYLAQQDLKPEDSLFGLNTYGVQSMLKRLSAKTGIQCNAHTFRRGFATELRKKGVNELDISELGRWSKVDMVKRYTKAYTFEDAAKRYQDVF